MLVAEECGRVLAGVPLLGPAARRPRSSTPPATSRCEAVAAGELRPAYVPARPPERPGRRLDRRRRARQGPRRRPPIDGDGGSVTRRRSPACPTRPAPTCSSSSASTSRRRRVAVAVEARRGVTVEPVTRYDATRSLGHVTLDGARGPRLDVGADALADAWYLAQALIAAESLGTVQTTLDMSVAYAKERFTFGRAIGSYQAVKHELTEVLRQHGEHPLAAVLRGLGRARTSPRSSRWRPAPRATAAGDALDFATRSNINVHGGIGATWEHDAPLFFRRAQLSRRLLGGTDDAADRVAGELLAAAGLTLAPKEIHRCIA